MSFERFLLAALLLAGCTVKEDRSGCGCRLQMTVYCPEGQPVRVCLQDGREWDVQRDTVLEAFVFVPSLAVVAVSGAVPGADGSIRVAEGSAAPPLYLFSATVETAGEAAAVEVRPRKAYCLLRLRFTAPPGYGPPFGLRLCGEVAGCTLEGGPLPGPFSVETAPDAAGLAAVRLPRQRDASLTLQLLYRDAVLRSFALGEYILAAGYDWAAIPLDDLEVEIDISLTRLTFRVGEWSRTEQINVLV